MWVRSLVQKDPLEEDMAIHFIQYSYLENPMDRGAWEIQSVGSQRVGHSCSDLANTHAHLPPYTFSIKSKNNTCISPRNPKRKK